MAKMLDDLLNSAIFGRTPSDSKYRDIARGAIERHLGDVCAGDESADTIYEEAFTIAFDALHDAGIEQYTARRIAQEIAQGIAQP
jgi:hypothetical protein